MAPKKKPQPAASRGASAAAVQAFAASNPNSRTAQALASPAPTKPANVTQAIRAASEGGVTKQELNQITKQFDTPANEVVQRLDQINQNLKAKDQPGINLNSGAVNMLIRQAEKQPQTGYDAYLSALTGQSAYGSGQIGKTIQSMIGSPAMFGEPATPGFNPGGSATANRMIGGTTIRPGGRIAVRPMGAAPAVAETVAPTMDTAGGGTTGGDMTGGDAFDFQSILDALAGLEQPEFDMSALEDMFNTKFDELSSQFETMKPLQLAQLGRAYGGDAIRAAQRMRKTRRDYRRGLPAQALGQAFTNLAIGGGMTL